MQTPLKQEKYRIPYYQQQSTIKAQQQEEQCNQDHTPQKQAKLCSYHDQMTPKINKIYAYYPLQDRPIRKGTFKPIRINRIRIINWMIEVFVYYRLGWETYWLCIELLDILIMQLKIVNVSNVHLIGVTCIFISSKYVGKRTLRLQQIKSFIYNQFSVEDLIVCEQFILSNILNDSYVPSQTIYHHLVERYSYLKQKDMLRVLRNTLAIWMKYQELDYEIQTYRELADFVFKQTFKEDQNFMNGILAQLYDHYECHNLRDIALQLNI